MQAILKSISGEAEFGVVLDLPLDKLITDYAQEPSFLASVYLCGQHQVYEFATFVRHIRLRFSEATALWEHLVCWNNQIENLSVKDLSREFELGHMPGESVHICFGPSHDPYSERHPLVSISVSAGALHGEYHFVTDQSCFSLFVQDFSLLLHAVGFQLEHKCIKIGPPPEDHKADAPRLSVNHYLKLGSFWREAFLDRLSPYDKAVVMRAIQARRTDREDLNR
jgi:hypothetical protein